MHCRGFLTTWANYSLGGILGHGYTYYAMATLYTGIGQYDNAIESLIKAKQLGTSTSYASFQYDINLEPLYELEAFQILSEPRWPTIKN